MLASRRNIILGTAAAGLVFELPFVKRRLWYSSNGIFELADPTIMRNVELIGKEIERWEARARALRQEQSVLIASFGGTIDDAGYSACARLDRTWLDAIRQSMMASLAQNHAWARALDDIYGKLRDGRLVARGRVALAGGNARKARIPAGHWATLRFDGDYYTGEFAEAPKNGFREINLGYIGDYTGAWNADTRYVELEIARS